MKFEMGSIRDPPGGFKDVITNMFIKGGTTGKAGEMWAENGRCFQWNERKKLLETDKDRTNFSLGLIRRKQSSWTGGLNPFKLDSWYLEEDAEADWICAFFESPSINLVSWPGQANNAVPMGSPPLSREGLVLDFVVWLLLWALQGLVLGLTHSALLPCSENTCVPWDFFQPTNDRQYC